MDTTIVHSVADTAVTGVFLDPADCRVDDLAAFVRQPTDPDDCPSACEITSGVPVYDCGALRKQLAQADRRAALMSEWCAVMDRGPGVIVMRTAFDDLALLDAATEQFTGLIEQERVTGGGGDHFAKPGANDRVWNALEKLCLRDPDLFARYYANDMIALASEAWLGPAYQVTSQINRVNPGGAAQVAHRDYHLGFFAAQGAARFPAHVHRMSPWLTLQGAVAHVDMPVASGPTLYLPHSQKYPAGYLVAGRPEFQVFFDAHHVQLPLRRGDAVFFNPALMHAAGHNRSRDILRLANLLQISSAFGRAMEAVDRTRMSKRLYPALLSAVALGTLTATQVERAVAACAEGYAFPTDLDRDPPLGGLAPESQQALMLRALRERWELARFDEVLVERAARQQSHAGAMCS
jgi:ectoine hydroxylase-related dioxygenase (phytanoyl-CoA dioxygenase family)